MEGPDDEALLLIAITAIRAELPSHEKLRQKIGHAMGRATAAARGGRVREIIPNRLRRGPIL